jgi:nitrite reductase/ring-hydroxylating ferredoxin subunit
MEEGSDTEDGRTAGERDDTSTADERDGSVDGERIAAVAEIPADGSLLFTIRDGFDTEEAILLETGEEGVVALKNYCPHWTDVRFDSGSGATVRDDELVCEKHGATFETDSGYCTHGPCEGATVEAVDIAVRDGGVYLTAEDYEFEHVGPSGDHDLSSRGRIGFSGN